MTRPELLAAAEKKLGKKPNPSTSDEEAAGAARGLQ
jgi:hypothetical protein